MQDGKELCALHFPPGKAFVDALHAAWEDERAVLPLPWQASASEVADVLAAARPALLVGEGGQRRRPSCRASPVREDVALVVPTSGTMGEPKLVELSGNALQAAATASLERIGISRRDRWLCCLPLHHIAGLMTIVRSDAMGVDPFIHELFRPEAVSRETGATLVSLVPAMLHRLLEHDADLGRWSAILLGGGPVARPVLERARAAGARVIETYGMTETCGGVVYDGAALPGTEVAISDSGEILIRGATLMNGYRLRPDLTAAALRDGWLHTRDLGELRDGRLTVLGRRDEIISTGGEKVAPQEVEAALSQHPLIGDVAVVGVPDDYWGERVAAVIVCAGREPTLRELCDFAARRVPRFKLPKELVVVDRIPRLASGKVDRVALKRDFGRQGAA